MRRAVTVLMCAFVCGSTVLATDGDWAYWRGPNADGMARGDAPLLWSDTERIRWKVTVPGKGHSSPVVWGDRIFLTTAVPATAADAPARSRPVEHRFLVLCYDRKTGRLLWDRVAKVDTPHESYHPTYGSFASNSPVTDGRTDVYRHTGDCGRRDLLTRAEHPVRD